MYSLGIDIGYSSIKLILMNDKNEIVYNKYKLHKGHVKKEIKELIKDLLCSYDINKIEFGAVTGSGSKLLIRSNFVEKINEVTSLVEGCGYLTKDTKSIIEIGGQNAKYITDFNQEEKSRLKISINSNCSAGTGSFLEEQVSRLNLNIEDYSTFAAKAESIPRIAGRCSVFAKTDIIHHQQEGVSVSDILSGLAYAVVKNYKAAVVKQLPVMKPIIFAGGVANNQEIIKAVKDVFNLEDNELIIPENFSVATAIGASLIAIKERKKIDLEAIISILNQSDKFIELENSDIKLPSLKSFGKNDSLYKHNVQSNNDMCEVQKCYLGVDIGSTSTNLVLMNKNCEILKFQYLRTLGNPVEAIKKGFKEIENEFKTKIEIVGVGITGSGRYMIGKLIGADIIKDEITAQAAAASYLDKEVDTIFEIGGQDSKFISLQNGVVKDFQMNKICAAGTGSFIEEQSKKFNIPINNFAEHALESFNPVDLGERCTVFIESSIATHLATGTHINDVAAGLCYSIVKNYLNRVVGKKKIGKKIFLQGGIAHNQGIVNAFKAITGKEICIPPFFSVTGAYGAAILTKEEMKEELSCFKGFNLNSNKIVEKKLPEKNQDNKETFSSEQEKVFFEGYENYLDPTKKTIGIPRALFAFGMFPMFNVFLKELGFNVLLSTATSEETIQAGQKYSLDETCYPVKLINGHISELVERKVDYIFFPDLFTASNDTSKVRKIYGCVYMQLAFKLARQALQLEEKGIKLLAPTIAFNLGKDFMMKSFADMGKKLGKNNEQIFSALKKAMGASEKFKVRLEEKGKNVLANIKPNEKVFVVISKIYGVIDPVLNMGIPDKLREMGFKVISFSDLMDNDILDQHPNMYWSFAQHILGAARYVKEHPNFYALFLTHHGCGPDAVVSHYFKEIMNDKPYLNIEVDEHSSGVGVVTRVEAFVNSLNKQKTDETIVEKQQSRKLNLKNNFGEVKNGTTLFLQNLYPYSEIFKEVLLQKGIKADCLSEADNTSVQTGRKYTTTNEYLSLTALIGDVFKELNENGRKNKAFFVLQNEGAEIDGQYSRLLRTKLDEEGYSEVDIISPFIEDLLYAGEEDFNSVCLALLAGDILNLADKNNRNEYLNLILSLIRNNNFELEILKTLADKVFREFSDQRYSKKVFAIGEPVILFSDFLNNYVFRKTEEKGIKTIFAPFSEYLWLQLYDFATYNQITEDDEIKSKLNSFKDYINSISKCLGDETPFEENIENLVQLADNSLGFYSGANGRYREAKRLSNSKNCKGIITVSSVYENTGIALSVIDKEMEKSNSKPILNLSFDGSKNENDEIKVNSFLHYL